MVCCRTHNFRWHIYIYGFDIWTWFWRSILLISIIFHFFLASGSSVLAEQLYFCCLGGLISSFEDCIGATGFGLLLDVKHLMWCLTIYGDLYTSSEKRKTAVLTILWNQRGSQGKQTHRTDYFCAPAVLDSPFYRLYYHTLHDTGKEKGLDFISFAFRGWCVSIKNQMEVEEEPLGTYVQGK